VLGFVCVRGGWGMPARIKYELTSKEGAGVRVRGYVCVCGWRGGAGAAALMVEVGWGYGIHG